MRTERATRVSAGAKSRYLHGQQFAAIEIRRMPMRPTFIDCDHSIISRFQFCCVRLSSTRSRMKYIQFSLAERFFERISLMQTHPPRCFSFLPSFDEDNVVTDTRFRWKSNMYRTKNNVKHPRHRRHHHRQPYAIKKNRRNCIRSVPSSAGNTATFRRHFQHRRPIESKLCSSFSARR